LSIIPETAAAAAADLAACDREPIHVPGSIQPHGALLALAGPDLVVRQASANAGALLLGPGREDPAGLLGAPLATLLPAAFPAWAEGLGRKVAAGPARLRPRLRPPGGGPALAGSAHRAGGAVILELEPAAEPEDALEEALQPLAGGFALSLQAAAEVAELGALAAREVRRLTGFDRVLVYRFDEDWNGTVVAEDRNDVLPSYLDLRFPASDIPRQARELYRLNRLRLIPDAGYRPVPLVPALDPATGRPLDLSFAALRSVSPVHLEYMRNMGTGASMSVSLVTEGGRLWGLIACHNREPRPVPPHLRTACDLLGQIVSLQIGAKEHAAEAGRRLGLRAVEARLLARTAAAPERFAEALAADPADLLGLTGAGGAAVLHEGGCALAGETPGEEACRAIAAWLAARIGGGEVFATDHLAREMPGAEAWKDAASGLLATSISQLHPSYVLWFRPEVVRTVTWAGDPRKPASAEGPAAGPGGDAGEAEPRIHPRRSFAAWRETVRQRSAPWRPSEVEAAAGLRHAIVDIVLRRAEELAALSEELRRSNKELEAFSYSVSHDLRAPFRHIVGYAELLRQHAGDRLDERGGRYLATIAESARSAGRLVDDLLNFSRMGRTRLTLIPVDMDRLVEEVRRRLDREADGRRVEWRIGELEPALADPVMLRLALENLLGNALKYTRPRDPAVIEVASVPGGEGVGEGQTTYVVRDNGVGFDMAYAAKLFGVFQRLHRVEEFEGTGIGLANVRRIMERHGGRVWAEGELDRGASFYFSLPRAPRPPSG
jgi:two-component system, chemotaxis family, sensor kinase Cph1